MPTNNIYLIQKKRRVCHGSSTVQDGVCVELAIDLTPAVADVMAWVAASSAVAVNLDQSGEISSEE